MHCGCPNTILAEEICHEVRVPLGYTERDCSFAGSLAVLVESIFGPGLSRNSRR